MTAATQAQRATTQVDIPGMQPGTAPPGFSFARTGQGMPGDWRVVAGQECRDLWIAGRGPALLVAYSVLLSATTYLAATNQVIPGAKDSMDFIGMNYYTRTHMKFITKKPFVEHVYKDASPRLKRLLGFLPHGAYG